MKILRTKERKVYVSIFIILTLIGAGIYSVNSLTRTISDTQDTAFGTDVIRNSNGKYWAATNANLQSAIYDLNGTGGQVQLPICNISITKSIKITNDVWLRGSGKNSTLYLANNANVTVIKNYNWDNPNHHIRLSDFTIDGNNANQPVVWKGGSTSNLVSNVCGILLFGSITNVTIENVNIYDAVVCGLWIRGEYGQAPSCKDITIDGCYISGSGKQFTTEDNWVAKGMHIQSANNTIITNCIVDDCFSGGIVMETAGGLCTQEYMSAGWAISNCIVSRCYAGIYIEEAYNGVISNCVTYSNTKTEAYAAEKPAGVMLSTAGAGGGHYNISVSNCLSYDNGYFGFSSVGTDSINIIFDSCIALANANNGFNIGADIVTISDCISQDNGGDGICLSASYNSTITGNRCSGNVDGIDEVDGSNYNIILGNNCLGNSGDAIDKNGANSIAEHNLGTLA